MKRITLPIGDFPSEFGMRPFPILFDQIAGAQPAPDQQYCYRRDSEVMALYDKETFPNYPVTAEIHGKKVHLLHESPKMTSKRVESIEQGVAFFNDVLFNPKFNLKTIVVFTSDSRSDLDYFIPQTHPAELVKIKEKLHVQISSKNVEESDQNSEIKQFKLTIKPNVPTPADFAPLLLEEKSFHVYWVPLFRKLSAQQLLDIYTREGDLAIHGGEKMSDAEMLEFTYCLFSQYDTFYPNGIPDMTAIQKKLEELRVKRPGMIRNDDEFRVAITLAEKLHLTQQKKTIQVSLLDKKIESAALDQARVIRDKKIDKQDFIKLDAILDEKNILTILQKYRDSKNTLLACTTGGKRRRAKLKAVIGLFKNLTALKEKADDNKINFNAYLDQIVIAVHQAITAINKVSTPENFGFFKRKYKQKKQSPGSHLLPILTELKEKIKENFASQLAEIEEQKKHLLPPINLNNVPFCPQPTKSRQLTPGR